MLIGVQAKKLVFTSINPLSRARGVNRICMVNAGEGWGEGFRQIHSETNSSLIYISTEKIVSKKIDQLEGDPQDLQFLLITVK